MELTSSHVLNRYIHLVDFLEAVLGTNYEIVLHDLTNLSNSIVAIRNNPISGREVGGPTTDLGLKILKDGELQQKKFITNYVGYSKSGKKLRSSTYLIRDDLDHIVGMLCINFDTAVMSKLVEAVQCIVEINQLKQFDIHDLTYSENFSPTAEELTLNSIKSIIDRKKITPERMTQEEKIEVVSELNDKGLFLLKGAVSEVAKQLKASEPSIYRYLQKIK
ncbi:MAG: hypothetical protein JWN30_1435 [Bacilli bacterium]|nr:hypothetical protein [Bacilli bacterium]